MTAATRVVHVADPSEVAAARRAATECAESLRFSETGKGRVALIATELATNLLKHGGGGDLLIGPDEDDGQTLAVIAVDKGPGIANITAAMRDGFSTTGTSGTGLGAVRRGTVNFDFYSQPGKGTAILCQIADEQQRLPVQASVRPNRTSVAGVCIAKPGESEPGDRWTAVRDGDDLVIVLADGLGHGSAAATAAIGAMTVVREQPRRKPEDLMRDAHEALRPTRGAAAAIARIQPHGGNVVFVGVGNIAGAIQAENSTRRTVSFNGIVGHEMRKVQSFTYPWTSESVLVLHSDGIGTSWDFDLYPGLQSRAAAVIAAVLYRDFCRGTDDATVVVARAV